MPGGIETSMVWYIKVADYRRPVVPADNIPD
jgi:hypothetical protein